jgi:putative ABC transport system substrate-binding protein
MPGSAAGRLYRDLIIALTARHKLPAVYYERHFAAAGGLMTYGPDFTEQYRRAAAASSIGGTSRGISQNERL